MVPFFFGRDGGGFLTVDWRRPLGQVAMIALSGRSVLVEVDLAFLAVATRPGLETDWANAFVRLEIAELHHLLWDAGDLGEVWRRFTLAERRATAKRMWTKGFAGRRVSEEWEDEISDLEVRFLVGDGDPDSRHAGEVGGRGASADRGPSADTR